MRLSGGAAGKRSSHPKLGPFDFASANNLANPAFATGQAGAPGLDFQKYDAPHPPFGKAVKDYEVYGAAEKANILGVVGERWEVRDQLLVNLAGRYRLASLNRILTNTRGVTHLPNEYVHPGHKKADRYSDDEPVQVRWQRGLARTVWSMGT